MKNKMLSSLLLLFIFLTLVGCCDNKKITVSELKNVQEKLTNTLVSYNKKNIDKYENFASVFVDEEKMLVIVELINNSKEQQIWFEKNIFGSKYIKFVQGGPYTTFASEEDLNIINDKIIQYFSSNNPEYNNLSFNYIDITNKVVVVGLLENTKEQQKRFKELVIDSELIEFIQGIKLNDYNSN